MKDDSPPLVESSDETGSISVWSRISLLDLFAGHALSGLLSNDFHNWREERDLARIAYHYAKAMVEVGTAPGVKK